MDMVDTLNIMTYAARTPTGAPGGAAWGVFRAEDSDRVRQFLRKLFKGSVQHDPIHSQQFYLDEGMRMEL
jgi:lysine-specific demethylase 3